MWSFRKTKRTIDELHFKDSYSALEHACKYMECRWEQDSVLPAIVKKVSVMSDGRQKFLLLVANEKKPREPVYAESLNKQVPYMNQEDFVGFMVCNIPSPYPDLGFGFVFCKLRPVYSLAKRVWLTDESLQK